MLKLLLLTLTIILSSCLLPKTGEVPPPAPLPVEVENTQDMKIVNEVFYAGLKNKLRDTAIKNGLKPLAADSLPKENIEIRLYLFASFFAPVYKGLPMDEGVLILQKNGANWSGKIIRNVIKPNSAKERITTPLNLPASGWENLLQKLQSDNIFAPPEKAETTSKNDTSLYVIETKENGSYNYYYFHVPKENSAIEEEKRVAVIFNLIAKEFDATDFKAS